MLKRSEKELPDGTYVDLVRSLYQTPAAIIFMSLAFLAVGGLVIRQTTDPLLPILVGLGSLFRAAHLFNIVTCRKRALSDELDAIRARVLERRFAITYFGFATMLGIFGARSFQVATADLHILVAELLFGYGAGLVAGVSLRPWISIPALILALFPTIIVAWMAPSFAYFGSGTLLFLFMVAGIQSMLRLYRTTADDITMRLSFATLARRDDLTGLPNRLELRESFERYSAEAEPSAIFAVHCLDLDRFKPVNDKYGHPAGDALLLAVAQRLNRLLRQGDIAARLGGDEFVIIQTGARHPQEADLLARRIRRSMAEPFSILGDRILIGASVGYALFPLHGRNLDVLLGLADEALVTIKRTGGGIAMHGRTPDQAEHRLSA